MPVSIIRENHNAGVVITTSAYEAQDLSDKLKWIGPTVTVTICLQKLYRWIIDIIYLRIIFGYAFLLKFSFISVHLHIMNFSDIWCNCFIQKRKHLLEKTSTAWTCDKHTFISRVNTRSSNDWYKNNMSSLWDWLCFKFENIFRWEVRYVWENNTSMTKC